MSEHLDRRMKAFSYHRPSSEVQATMSAVRAEVMDFGAMLDACIPECREKSLAFTALEEAMMWAIKGLSLTDPAGEQLSP